MKITALLVMRCNPNPGSGSEPQLLASASDLSQFGYFQRGSAKEFIMFVGRTIASRTPPGQRQSVQQDEYMVHCYNRNGLCGVGFMDNHYPVRSAFSVINKVLDEYQQNFGDSWKTVQSDTNQSWPYLNDALTKFQHKTIDSVLARGEKLDSLVEKSSDLSMASDLICVCDILLFYKQAKKTNQCCTIL